MSGINPLLTPMSSSSSTSYSSSDPILFSPMSTSMSSDSSSNSNSRAFAPPPSPSTPINLNSVHSKNSSTNQMVNEPFVRDVCVSINLEMDLVLYLIIKSDSISICNPLIKSSSSSSLIFSPIDYSTENKSANSGSNYNFKTPPTPMNTNKPFTPRTDYHISPRSSSKSAPPSWFQNSSPLWTLKDPLYA